MMNLAVQPAFDAKAYLVWEERQAEKHEFIAGEGGNIPAYSGK